MFRRIERGSSLLDFNHKDKTGAINAAIDRALMQERGEQPPRDYLGGSLLGYECERQLQFQFFNVKRDRDFTGRKLRIFEVGHMLEDLAARWLRLAGFDLETEYRAGPKLGKQIGFRALGGKIRGHRDGRFVGGPDIIDYPCLWECKSMADKYWRACREKGVMTSNPEYYGQVQVYMAYFDLTENPAIFTAINKNDQRLLHEPIDFAPNIAQALSDKGFRVIRACEAGTILPRLSNDPSFYKCRFCDWNERCHAMGE